MTLRVLDLFAGAGGFTLAGEMAGGYSTVAFCEIDKHAQRVLAKNWPDVPVFDDVTKLRGSDVGAVDVITGGFPCQDLSSAGRGAGLGEGTRSGLFREMLRLACEVREITGRLPYIVFENVPRLLSGPSENPGEWFGEFLWSLAEVGYDAEWFCITAASVGAPHERERVCVVAHPNRWHGECGSGEGSRLWMAKEAEGSDNNTCGSVEGFEATAYASEMQCDGRSIYGKNGVTSLPESGGSIGPENAATNPHQAPIEGGSISRRVYQEHTNLDCATGWWREWGGGEPEICGVDDGVPKGSYARRNGIMGNAIVPQVFAIVMKALLEAHMEANTA